MSSELGCAPATRWAPVKTLIFLLPLVALFLYRVQLLEANAYFGFIDVNLDLTFAAIYLGWLALVIANFPTAVRRPSDVFFALYLSTVALNGTVFWGSTGRLEPAGALLLLLVLMLPVLVLRLSRKGIARLFRPGISGISLFPERLLPVALLGVLLVAAVVSYLVAGGAGGFDILSMYDRRIAGRDSFGEASLSAYLLQMSLNGVAPLLAFLSARKKRRLYGACALAFVVFGFWLLGLKAPLMYVIAMYIAGYYFRRGLHANLPRHIVLGLSAVFLIAVLEYLAFDYSYVADYFIRRLFLVGAEIQTYFIDRIFFHSSLDEILFGLNLNGSSTPAFLIGLEYFGNEASNANTSAFLYVLGLSGLLGYGLCMAFLCFFMAFMDYLYLFRRIADVFAVTIIYSILLLEQSYTTAFFSSGVMLCLLLILLFSGAPAIDKRDGKI